MVSRWAAALTAGILALTGVPRSASAEIVWPEHTEGQRQLKAYAETADRFLIEQGEPGINSLFEAYESFAVFGITAEPGAAVPDEVEITASLYARSINSLQVRVSSLSRFPRIAAAFLMALDPENMTREEALKTPTNRMQKAAKEPERSFEDQAETLNGTVPYVYYAYYYNQYHDGVSWMQMTIIFPLEGYWNGGALSVGTEVTRAPNTYEEHDADWEGYDSEDNYVHYEIFMTPTPEPDSAAAEYDFR